jgi:hypothetical protein
MSKIMGTLKGYWLEILIGVFALTFTEDIRWPLFYFFIIFLIISEAQIDYLRKLVRVYQVVNEGKLLGIIKKLGITEDELQEIGDTVENSLTDSQRESLYKDMSDLGLK